MTSLLSAGLLAGSICFADQWDKKTVLQVSETVQVPGAVLGPGKYVVKLVESLSNRHIVQITNERGNHVFTTILAIPNYRLKPTDKSAFQWWEVPRGNPPAIRAWFYPGDNFGQEFAYPKGLSAKIAETAHVPVPATTATTPAEMKTAPVTTIEPSGVEKPLSFEAYRAPAPTEPVLSAEARPAPEPVPTAAPAPAVPPAAPAKELPATASPYTAYGLAGVIALAAGLAVRAFAHRGA
ncbi:MAG: hypothetical protein U0Q16_19160 [Bryobacteraceae bacterium]